MFVVIAIKSFIVVVASQCLALPDLVGKHYLSILTVSICFLGFAPLNRIRRAGGGAFYVRELLP